MAAGEQSRQIGRRSSLFYYLITLATGGVFAPYWVYLMMRDLNRINPKMNDRPLHKFIIFMGCILGMLGSVIAFAILQAQDDVVIFLSLAAATIILWAAAVVMFFRFISEIDDGLSVLQHGEPPRRRVGLAILTLLWLASLPYLQHRMNSLSRSVSEAS